jgi:hypothetical protein
MVQLDTRLPLGIQQPDFLNALAQGTQNAGNQAALMRQAEGQNLFRQHGAAAAQGDTNALAQIGGFDPMMMQSLDFNRQENRRADQRIGIAQQQLQLAREAGQRAAMEAQDRRAAMQEAQQGQQMMRQLAQAFASGDERAFGAISAEIAGQPLPMEPQSLQTLDAFLSGFSGGLSSMVPDPSKQSAAEQQIERIMRANPTLTYQQAVNIVDNVYKTDRDPLTRELGIVDMSQLGSGNSPLVYGGAPPAAQAQEQAPPPEQGALAAPALTFGDGAQFQNAPQAFGGGAVVRSGINTLADTVGASAPFPETMQAVDDFTVFKEGLVNSFASAYGRQPPSWLLQNIEALAPRPGRVFEGPERAQSKLRAMTRELETRRRGLERSMQRRMTPQNRSDIEGQIAGIDAVLEQINQSLGGFTAGGLAIRPEVEDRLRAYE